MRSEKSNRELTSGSGGRYENWGLRRRRRENGIRVISWLREHMTLVIVKCDPHLTLNSLLRSLRRTILDWDRTRQSILGSNCTMK